MTVPVFLRSGLMRSIASYAVCTTRVASGDSPAGPFRFIFSIDKLVQYVPYSRGCRFRICMRHTTVDGVKSLHKEYKPEFGYFPKLSI